VLEEVERQDRVQAAGAMVTVLERDELERHQWRTLADVLEHVPGLHVSTAGGRGYPAELSVRGASQHHTLFLLDGIELEDPAKLHEAGTSRFRSAGTAIPHLLIDDLERVEIWRGPLSARFGSGALGGVVRLITRRGGGTPGASAWTEFGAFGTNQSALRLRGGAERVDYTMSYTQLHTRGITASEQDAGGHERDGYDNRTLSSRVDIELTPLFRLGFSGRFVDTENELDRGAGVVPIGGLFANSTLLLPGDTRGHFGSTRQLFGRSEAELRLLDGRWRQLFSVSYSDHASREKEQPARFVPVSPNSAFVFPARRLTADGNRLQVGLRSELDLSPEHTVVIGVETERETAEAHSVENFPSSTFFARDEITRRSQRARNRAVFAEERFQLGALGGLIAGRLDDRSRMKTQTSGLLALEYPLIDLGTRIHATLGSAFRAPALDVESPTQVRSGLILGPFDDGIATLAPAPDTDPERTSGWELGVEQSFLGNLASVDVTYFRHRTRNVEVDFTAPVDGGTPFDFTRVDTGELAVEGVETSLELRPANPFAVSVFHTYTRAEERSAFYRRGADRLHQPKHELGARIAATFLRGSSIALDVRYVGRRKDLGDGSIVTALGPGPGSSTTFFARPSSTTLGGYTVVDLAASHTFYERYSVFARVENLFDREYSDRRYVEQPGIAGYVGVRVEF
jgi:vitamin B12 transporter